MGPEELGSVYESLLELVPTLDLPGRVFGFAGITDAASSSGNARKTTGSYYTPDSLVQELIKSALDPVIAQKLADHPANPIDALLSITVCDPSCGSGHFLLAAARRLAEKLAELHAPDGAVRPDDYRHALREVASRCLYGVDINPMAVELCRVALWLETVDPGKPLGFLNHHIRSGNSLLGTTPDLIAAGLPDDTFTAIEGDDKPACAELKKRNKAERAGFGPLFAKEEDSIREKLRQAATAIEAMDDSQPAALQQKEAAFLTNETAPEYRHAKLLADLWCAAFVIQKRSRGVGILPTPRSVGVSPTATSSQSSIHNPQSPIPSPEAGQLLHTEEDLFGQPVPAAKPTAKPKSSLNAKRAIANSTYIGKAASRVDGVKTDNFNPTTPTGITTGTLRDYVQGKPLPEDLELEVTQLAHQYRFFHWHLAFPQVFDQGSFDCILGNPPWERVKLQQKEWFAERRTEIAKATNASIRKKLIRELLVTEPELHAEYLSALRVAEGESHFLRRSVRFPFCGCGDINLYAIFAETNRQLLSDIGRAGCVLPTGIATDDTTKAFFQNVINTNSLISIFDFENRAPIFPAVDRTVKFCLFTCGSGRLPSVKRAEFVFFAHRVEDLYEMDRRFSLGADEIALLNPTTKTCPIFRSGRDATLSALLYQKTVPLGQTNLGFGFLPKIDMTDEVGSFKLALDRYLWSPVCETIDVSDLLYIRLYESKLMWHYEHRFATFVGSSEEDFEAGNPNRVETDTLQKSDGLSLPRYYVPEPLVADRYSGTNERTKTAPKYLLASRRLTKPANERTAVFAVLPQCGCGNSMFAFTGQSIEHIVWLVANGNSFIFDYCTRNKVGGTNLLQFILQQLPLVPLQEIRSATYLRGEDGLRDWLLPRVLELTYTAWDLEAFAADCGWPGPPFRWDEERRFLLRCELDAAFFHLYLGSEDEWRQQPAALTRAFPTPRHAVSYIMDTFPIVKRKDESKHGTYRTKDTILQIYDALAHSIATGTPYQTLLHPPPADPTCCHPPKS